MLQHVRIDPTEIVLLRARVADLEHEVKTLRSLATPIPFPAIPLTPVRARILHVIYRAYPASVSTEALAGFLDTSPFCVKVHICDLRRALAPFAITIHTRRGYGYILAEDSHAALAKLTRSATPPHPNSHLRAV